MLTAREAMERAVERAEYGDVPLGTLWLGIARELRLGSPRELTDGPDNAPVRMDGEVGPFGEPAETQCPFCPATSQDMSAHMADYHRGRDYGTTLGGEQAYGRAETEVIQRIPGETTPAYEAAGETLGETKSIPQRIAHPQEDDRGPVSMCINCNGAVIWIKSRGWCHDVPSHTASCEKAAEDGC